MDLPRYHRLKNSLYNLEGSACPACGAKHFPARRVCACGSRGLVPHRFRGTGKLFSYSEIFMSPEGYDGPYAMALVDLDEGPRLLAQITDAEPDDLRIGMRLEMVVRKVLESGQDGAIVYGYKFRPTDPPQAEPDAAVAP
jgi:uncharacterized OB-fold protein